MTDGPDTVFYDGACGLCHGFVRFLLARDPDGLRFRYAPLDGATFRALVPEDLRAGLPDSVVVRTADGALLVRGTAVLRALRRLPAPWSAAAEALAALPKGALDWGYDRVAGVRRRLFAKPPDVCPAVPSELRSRFLD